MEVTVLQIHKRSSYEFKFIEDKISINTFNRAFALSDGTTQSFNSNIWAEIITKQFVDNPTFNSNELIDNFTFKVSEYNDFEFEVSSNPAIAAVQKEKRAKGGTATFAGLQFKNENSFDFISCGDSNLFILNGQNEFSSFPFNDIDGLDSNNYFLNTEYLFQSKIDETYFFNKTIYLKDDDVIILVTDALSRLILKTPSILKQIIELKTFEQLHNFCLNHWERKVLEEDDISAIIFDLKEQKKINILEPPMGFYFPKEKEEVFIPTINKIIEKENTFNNLEMKEISNQFNGVANDFYQVKRKQKLHEQLLLLAISLIIINVCFSFYSTTVNREEIQLQKSEIVNRQSILKNAGYKINIDGVWGKDSKIEWEKYLLNKTTKKDVK